MKLPDRMRYIEAVGAGEPDVLRLATAPVPQMKPEEVLIHVQAAGVNRPDVLQRQGVYPPPPTASPILGLEVAGDVVAVGEAVTALTRGCFKWVPRRRPTSRTVPCRAAWCGRS